MKNQKENISVIASFVIVVIFVGLIVYFLMNKNEKVDPLKGISSNVTVTVDKTAGDSTTQTDASDASQNMDKNTKTLNNFTPVAKTNNLEKIDLVVGSGEEVKAGATVSVHYTGAIASTGVIFQASKDLRSEPITFPLSGVIKGWTDGIPGMKVGGTRRLIIPSSMAYGSNPPQGSEIPADADLVFDVELIAIK